MTEQDYCQYIISKCIMKDCFAVTAGAFRTTKVFLDAYKNSQSFSVRANERNKRIIKGIKTIIDEVYESEELGEDTKKILFRCRKKYREIQSCEGMFTVLSDLLWVMASQKSFENKKVMLIDDYLKERKFGIEWIREWEKDIKDAHYDLECMKEAENLPIRKKILQGLISNPDIAKYVNPDYISYKDFKQRIVDCQIYIEEKLQLYYAFMATIIYKEDLMRRYC